MGKDKSDKGKTIVVHLVTPDGSKGQTPVHGAAANPYSIQASRVGKKAAICYVSKEVAKKLGHLAADREMTKQDLLEEAIMDLLVKYRPR